MYTSAHVRSASLALLIFGCAQAGRGGDPGDDALAAGPGTEVAPVGGGSASDSVGASPAGSNGLAGSSAASPGDSGSGETATPGLSSSVAVPVGGNAGAAAAGPTPTSAPAAGGSGGARVGEGGHAGVAEGGRAGGGATAIGAGGSAEGGGGAAGAGPFDDGPRNPGATTLKDKYDGYFLVGAAVDAESHRTHSSILVEHFNSVTSENDMKFESLQPSEGNFTFTTADQMVDWAAQNGMQVRGHALVWHRQTPTWVFAGASREQLLGRMQAHISTVMEHFRGRVQVWDVVNEAVLPDGTLRTGEAENDIDESGWYRILGEDYVAAAFQYARQADPDARLFYNDYYNYLPAKWQATVELLKRAMDAGAPIDGVGLQCHINVEPSMLETHQSFHQTVENLEAAIQAFAALGLEVQITEMDVSLYVGGRTYEEADFFTVSSFTPALQEQQAARYREFFELFRRYRDVITSVTTWGVADDNTWLSEFDSGRQDFPLLFDVNHEPKPAFDAVMDF